MTPEQKQIQKQIAIAEWEGWTDISKYTQAKDGWYGYEPNNGPHSKLPPYLTSRDAICGAVGKLDDMEFCYFVEHLERVCGTDGWEIMGSEDRRKVLLATPSQMADALLLTLGHVIL